MLDDAPKNKGEEAADNVVGFLGRMLRHGKSTVKETATKASSSLFGTPEERAERARVSAEQAQKWQEWARIAEERDAEEKRVWMRKNDAWAAKLETDWTQEFGKESLNEKLFAEDKVIKVETSKMIEAVRQYAKTNRHEAWVRNSLNSVVEESKKKIEERSEKLRAVKRKMIARQRKKSRRKALGAAKKQHRLAIRRLEKQERADARAGRHKKSDGSRHLPT